MNSNLHHLYKQHSLTCQENAVTSAPQKLFLCFLCSSVLFSSLWSVCKWPRQFDLWPAYVRPCCLTFNTLTQQSCTKGCFPYQTNINGRSVLSDILQPVYQKKFLSQTLLLSLQTEPCCLGICLSTIPEHLRGGKNIVNAPDFPHQFYINIGSICCCCHFWCLIGLKISYKLCWKNVSTKFHNFVYTIVDIFVRDA